MVYENDIKVRFAYVQSGGGNSDRLIVEVKLVLQW